MIERKFLSAHGNLSWNRLSNFSQYTTNFQICKFRFSIFRASLLFWFFPIISLNFAAYLFLVLSLVIFNFSTLPLPWFTLTDFPLLPSISPPVHASRAGSERNHEQHRCVPKHRAVVAHAISSNAACSTGLLALGTLYAKSEPRLAPTPCSLALSYS